MTNENPSHPESDAPASSPARRAPGRPPARAPEETLQIIIDAAAEEFVTAGYVGANMARIAKRAGVSTRTLYRHTDTKDDLFRMVVEERIAATVTDFARTRHFDSPREELLDLTLTYARFVLGNEVRATTKILLEEQGRFPELAELFKTSSDRVSAAFDASVTSFLAAHQPQRQDAAFIALLLRHIFMGEQRQQLLGLGRALSKAEIDGFAQKTLDVLIPC